MKAVVLEVKDGYAAVLSEDGQFVKIIDDGYITGMELTLENKTEKKEFGKLIDLRSKRLWQSIATVAAALLIFIGVKDFNTPYGTISLDVNPSIEISINRYDRVLNIEAVNDDATEIVDELNSYGFKYKSVDDAVDMALDSFSEGDYAADDGTTYVVISANSENEKHSDKIVDELDSVCDNHADISAKTVTADNELLDRARKHGTTAGKLYLVESLKSVSEDSEFDESDWLKRPIKDIMHELDDKEKPNQKPDQNPDDGEKTQDIPSDVKEPKDIPVDTNKESEGPQDPSDDTKEPRDIPDDVPGNTEQYFQSTSRDADRPSDTNVPDKPTGEDGQDAPTQPDIPEGSSDGPVEPDQTKSQEYEPAQQESNQKQN